MIKFLLTLILVIPVLVSGQTRTSLNLSKSDIDSMKLIVNESDFCGNVLIYHGGKMILDISKGYSNNEKKILNSSDTRFNIGSIGKSLTGILLMQLVEKGVVELDKPANRYLPPAYQLPHSKNVTVRMLLNMQSGLGDYFDHPKYSDSISSIDGLMKLITNTKPIKDTLDMKFSYSNSGFIVIGKILENYYKKEFRKIVIDQILDLAGINIHDDKNRATGYSLIDSAWVVGLDNNLTNWSAAGGLYLTTTELHKIIKALADGKYLSNKSINMMWNKESHPMHEPPFINYGLGWMVESPGGVELRGHNGGVRGFQSAFRYMPYEDTYIYVFSNHENGAEETFMKELLFMLKKKGFYLN